MNSRAQPQVRYRLLWFVFTFSVTVEVAKIDYDSEVIGRLLLFRFRNQQNELCSIRQQEPNTENDCSTELQSQLWFKKLRFVEPCSIMYVVIGRLIRTDFPVLQSDWLIAGPYNT